MVVTFCGALVLIAQALEAIAAIGVALDSGAKRASCSEWAVEWLDRAGIVLVFLLAREHTAVLDTRLLLQVLNGVALGRERRAALVLVLRRVEAALGRSGLLLPEETRAVSKRRRVAEWRALLGEDNLLGQMLAGCRWEWRQKCSGNAAGMQVEKAASAHTFVVWFQLGEFLRCSWGLISDKGRPLPFVGEGVGVLLMRSGDTCGHCGQHRVANTRNSGGKKEE